MISFLNPIPKGVINVFHFIDCGLNLSMMRRAQSDKNVALFIGIFIFLSFLFYFNSKQAFTTNNSHNVMISKLLHAKSKFDVCMLEAAQIYFNDATKFFKEFSYCIKTYISIDETEMDNFSNSVLGEKKMFLPMSSEYHSQAKCRWLTIGIGGVTAAEELFKEKYPKCFIFGVEPADAGNFSKIGKLIPYGAEAETKLTVLENGKYISKSAKVLELTKILDEFVGTRFLHYLTIDIEGFEYGILRELIGNGRFVEAEIVICQIDAELHNPKFPNAHQSIKAANPVKFILNFLDNNSKSPYIPIFNVPYLRHPHQKVTFVNFVNPECRKAFNIESYFNKK